MRYVFDAIKFVQMAIYYTVVGIAATGITLYLTSVMFQMFGVAVAAVVFCVVAASVGGVFFTVDHRFDYLNAEHRTTPSDV